MFLRLLTMVLMLVLMQPTWQIKAGEKTESQIFVEKFKIYTDKNAHWLKPYDEELSPWLPYLTRPFDEGLVGEDLQSFYFFQSIGLCRNTGELEKQGFIALNPQLAAAFQILNIGIEFDVRIAPDLARGYLRCRALASLGKKLGLIDPINIQENAARLEAADIINNRQPVNDNPVHQLMKLAMCAGYGPAIGDLLKLDRRYPGLLMKPELAFLQTRAFHQNLPSYNSPDMLYAARNSVPAHLRQELDGAGFTGDPRAIINLLPLWHFRCGKTQFWRLTG